ncbi:MAG: single-stranded DNA-binding protein [Chloroflexi bacterium]|nr:single-stranded DNA-binding protein [Chloroflexota bacterium]
MRYTQGGKPVTTFTVAVNNRRQIDGQWQDETTWFRVTCWDRLAETTNQFLKRGRQVMVVGRISASAYISSRDNQPRASLELTAREVKFLGNRDDQPGDVEFSGGFSGNSQPVEEEEDLPF